MTRTFERYTSADMPGLRPIAVTPSDSADIVTDGFVRGFRVGTTAAPDAITAIFGPASDRATDHLALMGLTRVPVEEPI